MGNNFHGGATPNFDMSSGATHFYYVNGGGSGLGGSLGAGETFGLVQCWGMISEREFGAGGGSDQGLGFGQECGEVSGREVLIQVAPSWQCNRA